MSQLMLNIYLNFNGNCQEAFDFYSTVFESPLTHRQTYEQIPGASMVVPKSERHKLIHIRLKVGEYTSLMGNDRPDSWPPVIFENSAYYISINLDYDVDLALKYFDRLAEGGKVILPFVDTFWGSRYGQVTDKFGVQWMINCNTIKNN